MRMEVKKKKINYICMYFGGAPCLWGCGGSNKISKECESFKVSPRKLMNFLLVYL